MSFEVDEISTPTAGTGWNVVLTGVAQEVTDLDRPALVRLAPDRVTGRRITRA